jgi:UDP-glucose 4-epimerase
LRRDARAVLARHVPGYAAEYARRGWRMYERIDRVYDNARARAALGWEPRYDFAQAVQRLREDADPVSALARRVGIKGYHGAAYADGLYPVAGVPATR